MGTLKTTNIESISGSGTVTLGTSGETFAVGSGVTANGFGLAEADMWRCGTTQSISATTKTVINASWERNDSASFGKIGTGMTESSGIFTFPSTGIWLVNFFNEFYDSAALHYVTTYISLTIDDSNYIDDALLDSQLANIGATDYSNCSLFTLFDVTDTSNCKVKFQTYGTAGYTIYGNTDRSATAVGFIRLGDT